MKYCLLGLAMLVASFPLLDAHQYLGLGSFVIGGFLFIWFKDDVLRLVLGKAVEKGMEFRAARLRRRGK